MYKVMIVDDEPLFRDFLRLKMDWQRLGFEVCCEARNGQEALVEAEKHRPHLALVDINMPFMDGIELAGKLKDRFERIVIVFISGHNEFEYVQKAVRTGVQDYLLKPFNEAEMTEMLERIRPKLPRLSGGRKAVQQAADGSGTAGHASGQEMPELGSVRDAIVLGLRMKDADVLEEVRKAVSQLRGSTWGDEYADAMMMGLLSLALTFAGERGFSYSRVWDSGEDKAPYDRLKACASWDEAEEWLTALYRRVIQLTEDVKPTKASNLFNAAIRYIEQHYADAELSAEQVAGGVYVDSSYLRRVFRKESGHSIVDHLTHIRMKKARELLLGGNRRLADISESVGYADPSYFSKSFKKRFGVTPTEYEQLVRK
ncbi:response regulator transcription factor [Paenibacillus sp. FSL R7-0331]|uniref:response regulator transcription factor n=1 Tax=Paenibacillus sp. FSL R7-0331 TaxID=1536773 RepID=UPI0004F66FBB|nr:response regulator [Paenibacillus sp. FSL R7-0331]AIQ51507.1 chemotaxis protein CheY [Paenibacillus sp. FSL R7-0331]